MFGCRQTFIRIVMLHIYAYMHENRVDVTLCYLNSIPLHPK